MNIQRWKGVVWVASLAVGGYLVYYVTDFLRQKERLSQPLTGEQISAVLDSEKKPEEQQSGVVDYASIEHVFRNMDWNGKERPKVVAPPDGKPPPTPVVPVSSLLKVLVIQVDTEEPAQSVAWVKFVEAKLANFTSKDDSILQPNERLFPPFENVRVEAITPEGVVFAFDDPERPKETVATSRYISQRGEIAIVEVGPDGVMIADVTTPIHRVDDAPPFRPEETTQIRKNEYLIGQKTLENLDREYTRILSRDVRYTTYKNPKTGSTEGIKVNYVAPDSLPAQHGLTEGEVLKSINGHKVTSVNDAIAYVKANANSTDTWEAVFEKQGREFTRIYHSPER